MQCPSCHARVADEAKFCPQCGHGLSRPCPTCGHANSAQSKFCAECGGAIGAGPAGKVAKPAPLEIQPAPAPATTSAERRQLTIMFCDMVGSTALATRLDVEDLREVIATYHKCVAMTVSRFGGFVAKYMGDGVLVYFGYPHAHENDAEQAVRAALALLDAVGRLRQKVRIGIATGLVVIEELLGSGATQEQAVVGETPNLAARLQAQALPNSIVIDAQTHKQIGGLFEYDALGDVELKGFVRPVRAWSVLAESAIESRFDAMHQSGTASLVGREEEFDLLLRRWQQAKRGEGRAVLVIGEAGIGKSRLSQALQAHVKAESHTQLIYHCSPYHRDSALSPVIGQLTRAAGIERGDTAEARLAKLEALLAPSSEMLSEDVPLFAALLSIPGGERYPLPGSTPQELKSRNLAALIAYLKRLAARQPVLMVYEDLHWIDPTSLELLTRVVDLVPDLRVLLLATARSEFTPPWPSHRHVSTITLGRLDRSEGATIVAGVTGGKALPAEVLDQIVARADGIPLFIEELTKTVLESGLLQETGDTYQLTGPLPALAIPPTLHASLAARLDRLASVKDVAQIGAAIGRQFSHGLIADVAALPEEELLDALARLVDAELIFQRGVPPDAMYQFKHALVQDAAYASLVRSRRQQLHGRIASSLEVRFPELTTSEPETLARHYAEAGDTERGIELWQRAGERALGRCENEEALGHLKSALDQLATLADSPRRAQRELQLQVARGAALMIAHGQSTPEVEQAYSRARSLATHAQETEDLFPALMGMWRYYAASGAQQDARDVGELLHGLAEKLGHSGLRLKADMTLGITLYQLWEMPRALDLLRAGAEIYERDPPDERDVALFSLGQHPGFMCAMGVAQIEWLRGETSASLAWQDKSIAIGLRLSSPFQSVIVHGWSAVLSHLHRDWPRFRREIGIASDLAVRHRFPVWIAITGVYRGLLKVTDGAVQEGLAECSRSVDEIERLAYRTIRTRSLLVLAQAYGIADRPSEGLDVVDQAIKTFGLHGERWTEPELHRVQGKLLLQMGPDATETAMSAFQKAVGIAKSLGIPAYERRATMAMVRARVERGELQLARNDLKTLLQNWADDPTSAEWTEADALAKTTLHLQS